MLSSPDVIPFKKADDELARKAAAVLTASGYQVLRNLQVHCDNGRVTLQGRLPTYFLKQVAQITVEQVDGVRDVDNDIRVYSH